MRYVLTIILLAKWYFLASQSIGIPKAIRHYALFFSVSDYTELDTLSNPIRDAHLIGRLLESQFGFTVEIVENPDKREMLNKITEYRNRGYGPNDQLLIFFNGHGVFDSDKFQEGYFAPHDAKMKDVLYDSYLPFNRLRNWINTIQCPHILTVFDACQSGSFDEKMALGQALEQTRLDNWQVRDTAMISALLKPKSRLFITSASLGYAPDGKPNSNSPFALALYHALEWMNGGDGVVSFAELQDAIPFTVKGAHYGSFGDHEQGGEFLFIAASKFARPGRSKRTQLMEAVYNENEDFRWEKQKLYDKRDGRNYPTTTIGRTIWMAGDLQYNARIFSEEDKKELNRQYYVSDNTESFYKHSGYIYSFADAQNACPKGWHLPRWEDWFAALRELGGYVTKYGTDINAYQRLCKENLNLISEHGNYNGSQYWCSQTFGGLPCLYGFNQGFHGTGVEILSTRLHRCRCIRILPPPDSIERGWYPDATQQAVFLLHKTSVETDALADFLEKERGFQVKKIISPDFQDIVQLFQSFQDKTTYKASSKLLFFVSGEGAFDSSVEDIIFRVKPSKSGGRSNTIYLDELQQMADRLPFGQVLLLNDLILDKTSLSNLNNKNLVEPATAITTKDKDSVSASRGKPDAPLYQDEQNNQLLNWIEQLKDGSHARVSITAVRNSERSESPASSILTLLSSQKTDKILDVNKLYDSLHLSFNLLPQMTFGRHNPYSNFLIFQSPKIELMLYNTNWQKSKPPDTVLPQDFGAYLQFGDTLILDKRDSATYRIGVLDGKTWMFQNLRYPAEDSHCRDKYARDCDTWGRYYTWPAAQKACPLGWSLPDSSDYVGLINLPYESLSHFLQLAGIGCMNYYNQEFKPTGRFDQFYFRGNDDNAGAVTFDSTKKTVNIRYKGVEKTRVETLQSGEYVKKLNCHSIRCIKE